MSEPITVPTMPLRPLNCVCCERLSLSSLTVTRTKLIDGSKRTHEYALCAACIAKLQHGCDLVAHVTIRRPSR